MYTDMTSTDAGIVAWNVWASVQRLEDGTYTVTAERMSIPDGHGYGSRPENAMRTRRRAERYARSVRGLQDARVVGNAVTTYGRNVDGYPVRWSTYRLTTGD